MEGNYWSFYRGVDANQDGIGDSPYVVGEGNVDNYPLMGKLTDFTVSLGGKTYSIAIISNSTISQFQFSPDDARISFMAAGEEGTKGFSRIAVPEAFLQELQSGNLSFSINGEHPILKRSWRNGIHRYFYFSYVNSVSETTVSPWLVAVLASIFLIVSVLVSWGLKRKGRTLSRLFRERVPLRVKKGDSDYEGKRFW